MGTAARGAGCGESRWLHVAAQQMRQVGQLSEPLYSRFQGLHILANIPNLYHQYLCSRPAICAGHASGLLKVAATVQGQQAITAPCASWRWKQNALKGRRLLYLCDHPGRTVAPLAPAHMYVSHESQYCMEPIGVQSWHVLICGLWQCTLQVRVHDEGDME